jgi:hypothetical protein
MNRTFTNHCMRRIATGCLFLLASAGALATDAENMKDLDDETRATLVKTMAIMKRFDGDATLKQEQRRANGDIVQIEEHEGSRHGSNGRARSRTGRMNDATEEVEGDETPAGSGKGCEMNVGNAPAEGRGAIRRVTTVVTGNIVQMCR